MTDGKEQIVRVLSLARGVLSPNQLSRVCQPDSIRTRTLSHTENAQWLWRESIPLPRSCDHTRCQARVLYLLPSLSHVHLPLTGPRARPSTF